MVTATGVTELGRGEKEDGTKEPNGSCDNAQAVATVSSLQCPMNVCGAELETSQKGLSTPTPS